MPDLPADVVTGDFHTTSVIVYLKDGREVDITDLPAAEAIAKLHAVLGPRPWRITATVHRIAGPWPIKRP